MPVQFLTPEQRAHYGEPPPKTASLACLKTIKRGLQKSSYPLDFLQYAVSETRERSFVMNSAIRPVKD